MGRGASTLGPGRSLRRTSHLGLARAHSHRSRPGAGGPPSAGNDARASIPSRLAGHWGRCGPPSRAGWNLRGTDQRGYQSAATGVPLHSRGIRWQGRDPGPARGGPAGRSRTARPTRLALRTSTHAVGRRRAARGAVGLERATRAGNADPRPRTEPETSQVKPARAAGDRNAPVTNENAGRGTGRGTGRERAYGPNSGRRQPRPRGARGHQSTAAGNANGACRRGRLPRLPRSIRGRNST